MRAVLAVLMLLAGCGRIGFGLSGDPPPTDGVQTDGAPGDSATDAMMSMTGLDDTSSGSADGSTATVATDPLSTANGQLLIAAVHWLGNAVAVAAVSDSAGNLYMPLNRVNHPAGGSLQLWFANNSFGNPATVVTANFTLPTTKARILVHEYPSVAGISGQAGGSGSGTQATTAFVGASAGSLVFASCFVPNGGATSFSPGNDFALGIGTGGDSQTEDRLVATAGTVSAAMSFTPAANYILAFAVFDR